MPSLSLMWPNIRTMSSPERLLTTDEAASVLGLARRSVLSAIRRGHITAEKHGRDWAISMDAVRDYQTRHLGRMGRPPKDAGHDT